MKKLFLIALFAVSHFFFIFPASVVYSFDENPASGYLLDTRVQNVYQVLAASSLNSVFSKVDPEYEITWNNTNSIPTSVTGKFRLASKLQLFSLFEKSLPAGMKLKATYASAPGHQRYTYIYNGLRVYPGTLTVSTDEEGFMYAGDFPYNVRILNERKIDSDAAIDRATAYLSARGLRLETTVEPVFFDTCDGLRHAYLVRIAPSEPPGDFEVIVDAADSRILFVENFLATIDGQASIFLLNPLKCDVTTEKITNITRNGYLEGAWAKVRNEDIPAAFSPDNMHIYSQTDKHFDEAMVYYHIDRIHDYVKKVLKYDKMDRQAVATVYYGDGYDNAFYSPFQGGFFFGDGKKYNITSREESVIYHEYTHAVTESIAGLGTSGEAGGMNEGFSDYFAATLSDDPDIGEWVVAKVNRPYIRSCVNNSHYPEDIANECHKDSLMWSAPLWEMRQEFGPEIADQLAHNCRFYINRSSKFADGLRAIIKVDEQKYGGVHKDRIVAIFSKRGIVANVHRGLEASREREKSVILMEEDEKAARDFSDR